MPIAQTIEQTGPFTSATGRQWQFRDADERAIAACAQKLGLPDVLARILCARGIALEDAEAFLSPTLKHFMPDPSHLLDMDSAAERIAAAIRGNETIAIFGDYDVDGATSSALLVRYFRALGAEPLVHIPDRMKEGYGPNAPALLGLKEKGASVIITVDCGTLAFEPLEAAHEAGLDVIVIDHHLGEARKPRAYAVVNPNRLDETSGHRHLAAVGVAFLLIAAVNRVLKGQGISVPDIRQWLDIVALGTICDVVPLVGVNRALVAQGLKVMAARGNTGIATILDSSGVEESPGAYTCGFVIGPRINAGGRVGKSDLGVRLLSTDDAAEALTLAKELEQYNAERKTIEAMVLEQANLQADRLDVASPIVVVAGQGWHPGVIGIVAGRLKERFYKPTAVIAVEKGIGKASARSVSGVDFGAAVIAARDAGLLLAGGGHAMAAGFTVEEAKIPALIAFLSERMHPKDGQAEYVRRLMIDGRVNVAGATPELAFLIERLGPFGQGHPSVRLCVERAVNLKPEILKEQHVKTLLIDPVTNARLSAIAFRAVGTPLGDALLSSRGKTIDVAGQLKGQLWNGRQTVSLTIDDISI